MSKSWLLAMIGCALLIAGLATWSPVALVVLVVGVSVAVLAWLRPFYLLALLILTLPVHVFAMRFGVGQLGLSSDFMDKLAFWKEGVMLILIAVLAIRRLVKRDGFRVPLYLFDLGVACVALLMGVYVLVAPRLGIGVYGFRNYLEPLIPFYLLRFTSVTRRDLRNLLAGMMLVSMVIAVFGIYQANFWTFRDLYDWGFRDANGKIPDAFYMAIVERQPRLRAVSTVTSPNELGLILMQTIILSVVLLLPRERPGWQRVALTGLITVTGLCLLFTFSRSSFIGLVVAILVLIPLQWGLQRPGRLALNIIRNPGTVLVLIVFIVMLVIGVERTGLATRFIRAFSLRDPSAVGHLASYEASIPFIIARPLGIGMGMAGPRALRFADEAQIQHVESSYFQMMIEIGMPATLFVVGVLLLVVRTLRRQTGRLKDPLFEGVNLAAQAIWLGSMAAFVFLPLMQELQLMTYLWIMVAIPLRIRALEA